MTESGAVAEKPKREPISMPMKVLIGGILGVLTGVFFGEHAAVLEPIGSAYVLLVQAVVYPYIIASLLHGLGAMSPTTAGRLFRRGWLTYVAIWAITLGTVVVLTLGLPATDQLVYRPAHGEIQTIESLLEVLLPSDPFAALSQNHMPAVVIFCLIFGAALQRIDQKDSLLDMLETVRKTSLQFWLWTAKLVPYATFALFATSAGTLPLSSLPKIGLYLGLLAFGCLILGVWILPAVIAALAPTSYREIVKGLKEALTIAIATTVVAAALPYIIEMTRNIADRCGIKDEDRADVVATNISIAYVICYAGSLFLYLFVLFAAYYFNTSIDPMNGIVLPFVILLSSVGSSVAALSFIDGWLALPPETIQVYVETSTLGQYPKIVLSLFAIAFVSVLVTLNYYGRLKLRPFKLLATVTVPVVVLAVGAWGVGKLDRMLNETHPLSYADYTLPSTITRHIKVSYEGMGSPPPDASNAPDGETAFERIQRTGVLRVGAFDSSIPFVYRNGVGDLVGYDVAFAYELAHALDVDLVFVDFLPHNMHEELKEGRYDIAASGLYVTEERLRGLVASDAYAQSVPVLFGDATTVSQFLTRQDVLNFPNANIGVYQEESLLRRLKHRLPDVTITVVQPYTTLPDFTQIDAAVWSLHEARPIAEENKDIAVAVTENLGEPFVYVYYVAPESRRLRIFVDDLIRDLKDIGWHDEQTRFWLQGLGPQNTEARWSIMQNVLGWGVDDNGDAGG